MLSLYQEKFIEFFFLQVKMHSVYKTSNHWAWEPIERESGKREGLPRLILRRE